MRYAPIVVFGYNRADKLANLFLSLETNKNIDQMDLYIFVDVPDRKKPKDIPLSKKVIEYVNYYKTVSGFKQIEIEIAKEHKGLADSVISGVSKVISQYGKVIVLEDDLEVSNDFLDYMQRGLDYYKNDKRIWSLTGHCPMRHGRWEERCKKDVFLIPKVESLGWGTWKNRWSHVDWEVTTYHKFKKDFMGQALFKLGGSNLCTMLDRQMADPGYDSWAIRWSYQQFRERKYTVYPKETRVIHCGNDNRATHTVYCSPQRLKQKYAPCSFGELKPDFRLIWRFKCNSNRVSGMPVLFEGIHFKSWFTH